MSLIMPPWVRAALWAVRHLDDENAAPPSPLARRLLALGRETPDRLTAVLLKIEGGGNKRKREERPKPKKDDESRRLKQVLLHSSHLFNYLAADLAYYHIPPSFEITGFAMTTGGTVTFIIRSPKFEAVAEGEPIPHLQQR